ncbi:hypothetical protein BWD12_08805 [Leptospira santarosai serovar Bananal]|nr:hypothetical protein BWD11_00035 [Leptospira santarosai serovar Grippotyphosa]ONF79353.1 hypothetical protein BWD12_08805 [Leptospira santarosai serovar Bananal]
MALNSRGTSIKTNFSFDEQPQNGDFMQKLDFKTAIFGFYRGTLFDSMPEEVLNRKLAQYGLM